MNTNSEPQQPHPEILYKYRDWNDEYNKRSIKDLEVFFPSPRRFNDPFDCAIPFDPFSSSDDSIRRVARIAVDRDSPGLSSIDRRLAIESRLDEFRRRSKSLEYQERWKEDTRKALQDHFGVLSLTTDPANILMWSYYADKHAGICVGYDVRILLDSVNKIYSAYQLLPIVYQCDFPELKLDGEEKRIDMLDGLLTTKAVEWKHESEYRLLLGDTNEVAIPLPRSAIVKVVVGARMSEEHEAEVTGILESHGLSSTLYRAELLPDKYGLTIR